MIITGKGMALTDKLGVESKLKPKRIIAKSARIKLFMKEMAKL